MKRFTQDKDATLDYSIDWSEELAANGPDTIATSTWEAETGITIGADAKAPSHTATAATLWLSGGTVGRTYKVTNRIVTAGGRTDDRSFMFSIVEK